MKHASFPYRLYLVTDEASCMGRDLFAVVEAAVKGGVDLVQLREKNTSSGIFLDKARRLKDLLDKYNVPLIINDNLHVARACEAAGIHVGASDEQPSMIRQQWKGCGVLGYSLEHETQVQSAEAHLSDYLALSPVFSTPTKKNTVTEWQLEGISSVRSVSSKPLVAIGGMNELNAGEAIGAGADCIAVISAICSRPYPALAAERLREEIEKALRSY